VSVVSEEGKGLEKEFSETVAVLVALIAIISLIFPVIVAYYVRYFASLDLESSVVLYFLKLIGELEEGRLKWLSQQWQIVPIAGFAFSLYFERWRKAVIKTGAFALVLIAVLSTWWLIDWDSLQPSSIRMFAYGLGYAEVTEGIQDLVALHEQIGRIRDISLSWIAAALAVAVPLWRRHANEEPPKNTA
jgi:hypothetical protein